MNNETFVEVVSRDQVMRGMMHRPADFSSAKRYPAVMMWHGFTGARVEPHRLFVKTARKLADAGFIVVRFDFIGSGESDGEFIDTTPETEIEDALRVIDWLASQPGVDRTRLGKIGLSLGGLVSSCAASRSSQIKVLCLWAAVAKLGRSMDRLLTPEHNSELNQRGWIDRGGNQISRAFMESALRVNPLKELENFSGSALVIHGDSDETVPASDADLYEQALSVGKTEKKIIAGADHTFNSCVWESELIETTVGWLRKNL